MSHMLQQPPTPDTGQGVDVIFIDKYIDPAKSLLLLDKLQQKFNFDQTIKHRLASGDPVVIKHNTDHSNAEKLVAYIAKMGGDCWLQESTDDGYFDRRDGNRRQKMERRLLHRGWAILPDRRRERERRVFFH